MNYCTKCGSLYTQPGTCNCFAPPRPVTPVTVQPLPTPAPLPYIGDPMPGTTWVPYIPPQQVTVTYSDNSAVLVGEMLYELNRNGVLKRPASGVTS